MFLLYLAHSFLISLKANSYFIFFSLFRSSASSVPFVKGLTCSIWPTYQPLLANNGKSEEGKKAQALASDPSGEWGDGEVADEGQLQTHLQLQGPWLLVCTNVAAGSHQGCMAVEAVEGIWAKGLLVHGWRG